MPVHDKSHDARAGQCIRMIWHVEVNPQLTEHGLSSSQLMVVT
jgi:hypothetical protein